MMRHLGCRGPPRMAGSLSFLVHFCLTLSLFSGASSDELSFNVLVAGYEAFDGIDENPAEHVAAGLGGHCERVFLREGRAFSVCYEGWRLPVNSAGAAMVAEALRHEPYRWDAIIHLGVEEEARGLRLELAAANVQALDHGPWSVEVPCDKENTPYSDIVKGGPCVLPTTAGLQYLDLRDIEVLLELNGFSEVASLETWSRDAGSFYCNEAYYQTLWQIRTQAPRMLVPCLFVHLPSIEVLSVQSSQRMISYIAQSMLVSIIGLVDDMN